VKGKDRSFYSSLRALLRLGIITAVITLSLVVPAYAHGDMAGPAELGPPFAVSVALAVISYWLVLLWPRRARDDEGYDDEHNDDGWSGGGGLPRDGYPSDPPTKTGKILLKEIRVDTRDRVLVLAGSDETEGADHEEEDRFAIHSSGFDLHRGNSTCGIRPRRGR
jgi:hypothetical protein